MSVVSQLDGGLHVQYLAYEWTIVQGVTWHCQTLWSIFLLFLTFELSSGQIISFPVQLNICTKHIYLPGRVIIASVGVHCIVLSTIEAAIVRRPAHPAAASRVLLLGRVGLRAPREDGIDQVADEGNLQANDTV